MNTAEKSAFDEIIKILLIYSYPELLKEEYQGKLDISRINKVLLEKYVRLLMEISWALKKLRKYPLFFSDFYPETKDIKNTEALEHHIHAYLEDINIFKNKIIGFLGTLKNDLKMIAINKKEIDFALVQFIAKVEDTFKNVMRYRNPHAHRGTRFFDHDLTDAQMAYILMQEAGTLQSSFKLKQEIIKRIWRRENDSFKRAKTKWIGLAKANNQQFSGFIDEVFKRNKNLIYQLPIFNLQVQPVDKNF